MQPRRQIRPFEHPSRFQAKGFYGCVFRPALPLLEGQHVPHLERYISKVFRPKRTQTTHTMIEYQNEIEVNLRAQAILGNRIPRMIAHGYVQANLGVHPQHIAECLNNSMNANKTSIDRYPQIIYEDAGTNIEVVMIQSQMMDFFKIFPRLHNVFESFILLAQSGHSHSDVHGKNIVYQPLNKQHPVMLIDFGRMIPLNHLYDIDQDEFKLFCEFENQLPYEYTILFKKHFTHKPLPDFQKNNHNTTPMKLWLTHYKQQKQHIDDYATLFDKDLRDLDTIRRQKIIQFEHETIHLNRTQFQKTLYQHNIGAKKDNVQLGFFLEHALFAIINAQPQLIHQKYYYPFFKDLLIFIHNITNPHPKERWTNTQTLYMYNQLIYKHTHIFT